MSEYDRTSREIPKKDSACLSLYIKQNYTPIPFKVSFATALERIIARKTFSKNVNAVLIEKNKNGGLRYFNNRNFV